MVNPEILIENHFSMFLEGLAFAFVLIILCYFYRTWSRKDVKAVMAKPLLILDMNNVLVYRVYAPTQVQEKPESVSKLLFARTFINVVDQVRKQSFAKTVS